MNYDEVATLAFGLVGQLSTYSSRSTIHFLSLAVLYHTLSGYVGLWSAVVSLGKNRQQILSSQMYMVHVVYEV